MGEGISDATVSLSSLKLVDQVFAFGSIQKCYSVINSQFSKVPLKTQFGYSLNETQTIVDLEFEVYFGATLFSLILGLV